MKNTNGAHTGAKTTATTDSVIPRIIAATTAPPRLPSPPRTTMDRSREIRS
jgi:hypothetical protein